MQLKYEEIIATNFDITDNKDIFNMFKGFRCIVPQDITLMGYLLSRDQLIMDLAHKNKLEDLHTAFVLHTSSFSVCLGTTTELSGWA